VPFKPTQAQREEAVGHVLYEIEMFLLAPHLRPQDTVFKSVVSESYLLHARILRDFFQEERKHDDIVCDDYGFHRDDLHVPDEIQTRFDKSLAHLTYSRNKYGKESPKEWINKEFRPHILARAQKFLEFLLTESAVEISPAWRSRAAHLVSAIRYELGQANIVG
jgi:hypothetical protein